MLNLTKDSIGVSGTEIQVGASGDGRGNRLVDELITASTQDQLTHTAARTV